VTPTNRIWQVNTVPLGEHHDGLTQNTLATPILLLIAAACCHTCICAWHIISTESMKLCMTLPSEATHSFISNLIKAT